MSAGGHRDYTFLGTTQSLCPECLAVVPAKIIVKRPSAALGAEGDGGQGRVYFRKTCPEHGSRDDFVCSDAAWYDQMEFALPARMPAQFGVDGEKMRAGRIYVAPPDRHLLVERENVLRLGAGPKENMFRPAVDPLFRSAAREHGPGDVARSGLRLALSPQW